MEIQKKSGYVEETFSYGKCGYIRELRGGRYYYNSKSFAEGQKRRLNPSDTVVFLPSERTDEKTGKTVPFVVETVSLTAALRTAIEELSAWEI